MGPGRKRDVLEQEMELGLRPGRFVEYGSSWSFVSGLDGVAGKIAVSSRAAIEISEGGGS